MKRRIYTLLLGLIFLSCFATSSYSATVRVLMRDNFFDPAIVNINVGDIVEWENVGVAPVGHTATSGTNCTFDGAWSSEVLATGGTYQHQFDTAGSFPYFCIPHCVLFGMVGTVNVGVEQIPEAIQWSGPVRFNIRFTTTGTNAAGNRVFVNSTQTFTGTIQLIMQDRTLLADPEGCFVKFLGGDGTKFCFEDKSFLTTFNSRTRNDQLSLIGTGVFSRTVNGELETGPVSLDTSGTLRKDAAGELISIALNGRVAGGASDDEFIFRSPAIFRSTLTPVQNVVVITTALTGGQEVPPVETTGSGTAIFTVNMATGAISGRVEFNGLSSPALAAHIHQAPAGVNGGVIIPLEGGGGVTAGEWTVPAGAILNSDQLTALQADGLYVNIHTPNNPGGEIRGQIIFPGP